MVSRVDMWAPAVALCDPSIGCAGVWVAAVAAALVFGSRSCTGECTTVEHMAWRERGALARCAHISVLVKFTSVANRTSTRRDAAIYRVVHKCTAQ